MDHYQCLGVGRSASPNQIEAAARLALLRHGADAELTERIMDAWSIVGDPDRRFDYDFWLLTHPSPAGAYASVERAAAPPRVPEPGAPRPDAPRTPGPQHASGQLPQTVPPPARDQGPGPGESLHPAFNLTRLLVLLGLVAAALGLVAVLLTSTPTSGILLVNGMCWLGLVLVGRLWPRAGIPGGHSRNT